MFHNIQGCRDYLKYGENIVSSAKQFQRQDQNVKVRTGQLGKVSWCQILKL